MSIVRKSSFRHVYADTPKTENIFQGFRLTTESWDMNYAAVNPLYLAIPTRAGGGSAVAIFNVDQPGRYSDIPVFAGHRGPVLNMDWNPFNDQVLATCSADCFTKLWVVPESGLEGTVEECAQELRGHSRKVGTVKWNPTAENILATSSADFSVKIWDARNGSETHNISGHSGLVTACEWNHNGSLLATACKDKKLRVVDPRAGEITAELDRKNHQGTKGNRVLWQGKQDKIISFGFGNGQRQYSIYDLRDMTKPYLAPHRLDSNSGSLIGWYDSDIDILYLGGKGDGIINYYEFDTSSEDPKKTVFHLSSYNSNTPQAGLGFMPKRGCDVNDNEIARIFKVEATQCSPLKFIVPRRMEGFADDIYPPTASDQPALSADQWIGGETSDPLELDLSQGYTAVAKAVDNDFEKVEVDDDEPKNLQEYKHAYKELTARVAYLEAEVARLQASA
eukprot:TRINITY_DN7904_c0_g1_i1.p1 TRINITY_DN7904_c0_g1~~TRINITY_DN7904_c0_g1_i1.p1  ORF type:complete len:450 (+),score=124.86 TRINITY_DN7904_c0_g1_i1:37-1386(+)